MRAAASIRFLLASLIALSALLLSAGAEAKRVALIIANGKYQHLNELPNPANDAKLIKGTLRKAGFAEADITIAQDLGHDAMRRTILAFKRKASGAEAAVLYFAGHGLGAGENFLIPVDAQLQSWRELGDEGFSQRVLEDAVDVASGLKLVILDACRNDPTRGRMAGVPATRAVDRGLRQVEPEGGGVVWYSAKHGTVALDGPDGGNSPFAVALSQHLATPGRDIRFVFGSLRDAVIKATNKAQEPFIYGSLGGDEVYLVPPAPQAKQETAPQDAALRDWELVKDSDSIELLEAFRKQHGERYSLYGEYASQRIQLLKKWQAPAPQEVAAARPVEEKPPAAASAVPPAKSPKDIAALKVEPPNIPPPRISAEPAPSDSKARQPLRSFKGHSDFVTSIAYSTDGRFALSGSHDETVKLWDVGAAKELRSFKGHRRAVSSVAFSPDGRFALSGGADSIIMLWDVNTGQRVRSIVAHREAGVSSLAVSPDGQSVLSGMNDGTLKLWEIGTGKEIRSFAGDSRDVTSVVFSPDGRFALSGGDDDALKLWDVATGKVLRSFWGHAHTVTSAALSPDGRLAISTSKDHTIRLWDARVGKELRSFAGHLKDITSVALSPDGRFAVSGSCEREQGSFLDRCVEGSLKLWDLGDGKELHNFVGHSKAISSVAFSPDGRFVLSGSWDATLGLWDVSEWTSRQSARLQPASPTQEARISLSYEDASQRLVRSFAGHSGWVSKAAFSPDGSFALSSGIGQLKLWEVETGKEVRGIVQPSPEEKALIDKATTDQLRGFIWALQSIKAIAFSPDGRFALSSGGFSIDRWEVHTGKSLDGFSDIKDFTTASIYALAFSPDGRLVASGTDKMLKLWEIGNRFEARSFAGHSDRVAAIAFSPNGRFVLSGSHDKTLKLWDVATGKELRSFMGHSGSLTSVAFSPDGRLALSGSGDFTLKLWDVQTGNELRNFVGHSYPVTSVCFSPDGRFALSGGDTTLKLWEAGTGRMLHSFEAHSKGVSSAACSPDGRFALSSGADEVLKLWDLSEWTGAPARLQSAAPR